jgi:O-methyltransferase
MTISWINLWIAIAISLASSAVAFSTLVPGGIIVYDDYGGDTTPGIARYVDSQLQLEDRTVLHNLNGHAIVIKR